MKQTDQPSQGIYIKLDENYKHFRVVDTLAGVDPKELEQIYLVMDAEGFQTESGTILAKGQIAYCIVKPDGLKLYEFGGSGGAVADPQILTAPMYSDIDTDKRDVLYLVQDMRGITSDEGYKFKDFERGTVSINKDGELSVQQDPDGL